MKFLNWFSTKRGSLQNFLSDTKIVRHMRLRLDINPYLNKDYFVLRKLKLGVNKLTGMTSKVRDKAMNIYKLKNETMTNNCCPI